MFRSSYLLVLAFLAINIFFLGSCIKDLAFDLESEKPKMVINCIFYPREKFKVRLTTSRNILDPNGQINRVSGATVVIRNADGEVLEFLSEVASSGLYTSDKLLAFPGQEYRLEVSHPDFEDKYYAKSSVPVIKETSTIDTSIIDLEGSKAMKVNVLIDDNDKRNEIYIFEVEIKDKAKLVPLLGMENDFLIYGDENQPKRLFLGDVSFNGGQRSVNFLTFEGFNDGSQSGKSEIRMLNASYELSEYYRSLEEYDVTKKALNPNAIPAVKIFSNIQKAGGDRTGNGLGIFAGTNVRSMLLEY